MRMTYLPSITLHKTRPVSLFLAVTQSNSEELGNSLGKIVLNSDLKLMVFLCYISNMCLYPLLMDSCPYAAQASVIGFAILM